jgi:membrane associated rhomboid family serine protease
MRGSSRFEMPSVRSAAAQLAIAVVGASILGALLEQSRFITLRLVPQLVFSGQFWQPLTYVPLEVSPTGVLFGALIIWSIGSALESSWGRRRFLSFAVGTTFAAGLLTLALARVAPSLELLGFAGGTVMASVIWIGYGLSFGQLMTNFWGMPVTGNVFALIGVFFVLLNAVFSGWQLVVPDVFGILLTVGYIKLGSPRLLWLRLQSWRLQRQLRGKAKHLKVVRGERDGSRGSDRFLH